MSVDKSRNISVIVVGGSYAGAAVAKKLAGLSQKGYPGLVVTLVDQSTHYFHAVGFPKALVSERFADKCFLPFSAFFDPFSKHQFVHGKLERVVDDHHIEVSGQSEALYFDYLVIATGGKAPGPINVVGPTKEAAIEEISTLRSALETGSTTLVVGGGPVGVEVAGFIASKYKKNKVTLVHGGNRLLPPNFCDSVGNAAQTKLESLGVRVVLNERVEIPEDFAYASHIGQSALQGASGAEYSSDVQILAVGFRVYSEFLAPLEEQLGQKLRVEDSSGFIRVRPTLQIDSDRLPHVFVAGDATSLPMSTKYGFKAEMQGGTVAGNIKRLIDAGADSADNAHGERATPSLSKWVDYVDATLVPIGPRLGVAQMVKIPLGNIFLGNLLVANLKAKDFMIWLRKGYFPYH
ncbi:hypothetical protein H4S06_004310 [Coemansia sp. BCRC 34490]|nr:hypothetical protein H4S06_004310 [Coemansia sp. BCRC 34490]